jgi:hypothetical protein
MPIIVTIEQFRGMEAGRVARLQRQETSYTGRVRIFMGSTSNFGRGWYRRPLTRLAQMPTGSYVAPAASITVAWVTGAPKDYEASFQCNH